MGLRPWMLCYMLLGFVQSGLVPILLPLSAPPGSNSGLTYATFAATGILAPFIGAWSDRHRRHRLTVALGLALAGLALLAHALPGGIVQHMATAGLIGLGMSSASTVSTMFIVEVEPKEQWDGQIGLLQGSIGSGQLVGLLAAGVLGLQRLGTGFLLGAGLMLTAAAMALALAPRPVAVVARQSLTPRPARGAETVPMGPQRSLHRLTWGAVAGLRHSGLAWFLAAWLVSYTAASALSVMFAVEMVRDYHAPATYPTTAYAIGVGLSLVVFRLAGGWDKRFGASRVLMAGLGLRVVVLAVMVALAARPGTETVLPLLVCFGAAQVIWPLLSVSGNTLAVTLSPAHRAESVGLLNAASSIASTAGGVLGGMLLQAGFVWLCAAVLGGLLLALLLAWHPKVRLDPAE